MTSGLRQIELVEHGIDVTDPAVERARHVVGIDESGNHDEGPFVMVAVQCPRSTGETLAELLIDLGLQPWKSKSSSTPAGMTNRVLSERVASLIGRLSNTPITWTATAGWGSYGKHQRAMTACVAATGALTGRSQVTPAYEGPAALIHDGGSRMYGQRQDTLRRAASRQFQGFGDRVTPVYLTQVQDGDRIYPEITTADYIAGYLRDELSNEGIEQISGPVRRIDPSWKAADDPPQTLYNLRARNRRRSSTSEDRAAAWIEGRRPAVDDSWGSQPIRSIVDRLRSDIVREYLLNEL